MCTVQVACNLRAPEARGKTLFLWNTFDDDRMKDVPFFCFSHLVMRIEVAATCTPRPGFPVSCAGVLPYTRDYHTACHIGQ
jgi:hypothetical protein